MGLKILSDGAAGPAVFYDSATMTAFGPVMTDPVWAAEFIEWLEGSRARASALETRGTELTDLWGRFESEYVLCDECGVTATPKGHPVCSRCASSRRGYARASGLLGAGKAR